MMAATYSQHPNQMQQHPVQQGPQQHVQGHPGQPNAVTMQHIHPQQQAAYQQQLAARQSIPFPFPHHFVFGWTVTQYTLPLSMGL
jgi:hypothetical protein